MPPEAREQEGGGAMQAETASERELTRMEQTQTALVLRGKRPLFGGRSRVSPRPSFASLLIRVHWRSFAVDPHHYGSDAAVGAPEEDRADGLEEEIGQPDDEVGRPLGAGVEGLAEHDEAIIDQHQNQSHGDTDVGFAAVDTDAQGNAQERETET